MIYKSSVNPRVMTQMKAARPKDCTNNREPNEWVKCRWQQGTTVAINKVVLWPRESLISKISKKLKREISSMKRDNERLSSKRILTRSTKVSWTQDIWHRDTWHQEATWLRGEEIACSIREIFPHRMRLCRENWTHLSSELTHIISRSLMLKILTLNPKLPLLTAPSTRSHSDRTRFWSYKRNETAQETTNCIYNSHFHLRIQINLRISKRNKTLVTTKIKHRTQLRVWKISKSSFPTQISSEYDQEQM